MTDDRVACVPGRGSGYSTALSELAGDVHRILLTSDEAEGPQSVKWSPISFFLVAAFTCTPMELTASRIEVAVTRWSCAS